MRGWAEVLPPTAAKILKTARQLLVAKGFEALSLESIAAKAGVNKAATRYHFGSKAGLIEALVDEIVLDECDLMARDISPDAPFPERVDSFIESVRSMISNPSTGFFEILPYALRTRTLRVRLIRLYEVWCEWNLEWLMSEAAGDGLHREELAGIGKLTAAAIDGIAIQAAIYGSDHDSEPALETLRYLLVAGFRSPHGDDGETNLSLHRVADEEDA